MFYDLYEKRCKELNIFPASQEMADALSVNRSTITCWKKNGNMPKMDIIIRASKKLNVDVSYFLTPCSDTQKEPPVDTDKELMDCMNAIMNREECLRLLSAVVKASKNEIELATEIIERINAHTA